MEYSVSELARIVGKSRQYVQKKLRELPRKKRPGRGGEYSYSINDLPIDIQKTVLLKEQQNHFHIQQKDLLEETSKEKRYSTSNASSLANHVLVFDDPESEARADQRMRAWIEIFRLQDDWCYENKITKVVERDVKFADIYNREELIIPLWIRTVIPSLSRSNLAKIRGEYEKKGRNGLRGNYGNRKGQQN